MTKIYSCLTTIGQTGYLAENPERQLNSRFIYSKRLYN